MKFDDLDKKMRVYETAHDHCALPNLYLVARLDGRSFTRLTKKVHKFDAPYDERFRDLMVDTTEHLMTSGFNVLYGYTQSDEISLLFDRSETTFARKLRKFNSVLSGEASAKLSLALGGIAAFDCRISQLPTSELVQDYFRWRNEDAHRNALNSHCYWSLRAEGLGARQASGKLLRMSVAGKNELLFQKGVNFNELPNWQKRGVGLYWETYQKEAGEQVTVARRRIKRDYNLLMREEYSTFLRHLLKGRLWPRAEPTDVSSASSASTGT